MTDIKELTGKRIKELRLKKGLKQSELAELVSLEPRSISRIESGHHFPKDEHLQKFAGALGVEVKDLFSFSHIKSKEEMQKVILNPKRKCKKILYKFSKKLIPDSWLKYTE